MRVALRCDRHKHGVIDMHANVLEIKCQHCSKAAGRPVYHHWRINDATVRGADLEPEEPHTDERASR